MSAFTSEAYEHQPRECSFYSGHIPFPMGVKDESGRGHRKVAYGLSGATGIVHCLCSKMPMKKILVTIQEGRAILKDPKGSCDQFYHHRDY